jgi:hypothetical protein
LEKERLYLELQEEKKAQAARERRIKEQEQKIENLSSLFMNSNVDDRDAVKSHKKVTVVLMSAFFRCCLETIATNNSLDLFQHLIFDIFTGQSA